MQLMHLSAIITFQQFLCIWIHPLHVELNMFELHFNDP